MFWEISGPLSHVAYTERSTIVDLLIKIPGPLNPAAYWKVHYFFKRSKICQKRSNISNAPPPLEISLSCVCGVGRVSVCVLCACCLRGVYCVCVCTFGEYDWLPTLPVGDWIFLHGTLRLTGLSGSNIWNTFSRWSDDCFQENVTNVFAKINLNNLVGGVDRWLVNIT